MAYVDVTSFGAAGNGTTDDTTAIQNAIDSLTYSSTPGAQVGGTVFFPVGRYKITQPLLLRGGQCLLGTGTGSSIEMTPASGYEGLSAIQLEPAAAGYISAVMIEKLRIYNSNGHGIRVNTTSTYPNASLLTSAIRDNVIRAVGGWAIFLHDSTTGRSVYTQSVEIVRNHMRDSDHGFLYLEGNLNTIRDNMVPAQGVTQAVTPGVYTVIGDGNLIEQNECEGNGEGTSSVGFYVSGANNVLVGNWTEAQSDANNIAVFLENMHGGALSDVRNLAPTHKLKVRTSHGLRITQCDRGRFGGDSKQSLQDCIDIDTVSMVEFEQVEQRRDWGVFDNKNILVRSARFGTLDGTTYVPDIPRPSGAATGNLIVNGYLDRESLSSSPYVESTEANVSAALTYETRPSGFGKRLKLTFTVTGTTSNRCGLRWKMYVPGRLAERDLFARLKVNKDADTRLFVLSLDNNYMNAPADIESGRAVDGNVAFVYQATDRTANYTSYDPRFDFYFATTGEHVVYIDYFEVYVGDSLASDANKPVMAIEWANASSGQDAGSAAPTSGTWPVGWVRWNTAPASLGYVGWVCTTAGAPGTWKGFGAIA